MKSMLSLEAIKVVRPVVKLNLSDQGDLVHCTGFNAHILRKMMGIDAINYINPERALSELTDVSLDTGLFESTRSLLWTANTGNRRTVFGKSVDRVIGRRQNRLSVGMSSSNRCVSLYKIFDQISRQCERNVEHLVNTGEFAFSKDMRVTKGLAVQGDSISLLKIIHSDTPKIRICSSRMLYDERFSAGIWSDPRGTSLYEKTYRSNMIAVIHRALDEAGIALKDVDCLLPHNINSKSWQYLIDDLKLPREVLYDQNIRSEGHCFCNDLSINLSDALKDECTGRYLLTVAAGAGGMFGAAVLETVNLTGFSNERHYIKDYH